MQVIVSKRVEVVGAPKPLLEAIVERLTIDNPRWLENEKMGRWNGETPRYLRFYERFGGDVVTVPRGFAGQLIALARRHRVNPQIIDRTRELEPVEFFFSGNLRGYQAQAIGDIRQKRFGTLSAATGSGKTVIALALIADRQQPSLVVVHTGELLLQWIARIETFLGISAADVGQISAGKKTIGAKITVALVQSLYKCADKVAPRIGFLVVDECHRTPSRTFTEAVSAFDSRYMLGLSATPWRRDKLSRLIFWYVGDVVHEIDKAALLKSGHVLRADVVIRETDFTPWHDASEQYSRMLSELTKDERRNALIVGDVARVACDNGGGVCLVLSDRKAHCETLREMLARRGIPAELLIGSLSKSKRERVVSNLNEGAVKVVCATGQLIGEGFDCKNLQTLFLATPIKFNGRLIQYLGRVLRPAPGKEKAVIYDYVDIHCGVLSTAAKARRAVYDS